MTQFVQTSKDTSHKIRYIVGSMTQWVDEWQTDWVPIGNIKFRQTKYLECAKQFLSPEEAETHRVFLDNVYTIRIVTNRTRGIEFFGESNDTP